MSHSGKTMYCAFPTRLMEQKEITKNAARDLGYVPVSPFDLGTREDWEDNPAFGREKTLAFMLKLMHINDAVGIFGISEGVLKEWESALDSGQEIRIVYGYDPQWEEYANKSEFKVRYQKLLRRTLGPNCLFALVGPRAVGKTYWSEKLVAHFDKTLKRVKNTTSRPPRDEKDYESYNFVSRDEFREKLDKNGFLEWDSYQGEYYGSSLETIKFVLQTHSGIFAITPNGAEALYRHRFEINLAIISMQPTHENILEINYSRRNIHDPIKREELLKESKSFSLNPEIPHDILQITGKNEEDWQNLLKIIKNRLN